MSDLVERLNKIRDRVNAKGDAMVLTGKLEDPITALLTDVQNGLNDAIAALSLPDRCEHEWIDPSNKVVDAGGYRLCLKCNSIAIPESPVMPDEVEWLADQLHGRRQAYLDHDTWRDTIDKQAADLLERLWRENEAWQNRNLAQQCHDQATRIDELEAENNRLERYKMKLEAENNRLGRYT